MNTKLAVPVWRWQHFEPKINDRFYSCLIRLDLSWVRSVAELSTDHHRLVRRIGCDKLRTVMDQGVSDVQHGFCLIYPDCPTLVLWVIRKQTVGLNIPAMKSIQAWMTQPLQIHRKPSCKCCVGFTGPRSKIVCLQRRNVVGCEAVIKTGEKSDFCLCGGDYIPGCVCLPVNGMKQTRWTIFHESDESGWIWTGPTWSSVLETVVT